MDQAAGIWSHCLEYAALSDIGLRRANNQDSYKVVLAGNEADFQQRGHLFIVADGMGAHAAGELASKMATDVISLDYRKLLDQSPPEAILSAVLDANRQIHTRGQASPEFRGMGTTATMLLLLPAGALVAHVGDSRAYRLRGNRIEQLTFDHSLVWEMQAAGQLPEGEVPGFISKNIITRSLGPNPTVQVDLEGPHPVQAGDTFLLCSDGLSNQVTDDEIGLVLSCLPPGEAVHALIELACLRGGPDNITAIIVRVARSPSSAARAAPPVVPRSGRTFGPSIRGCGRCWAWHRWRPWDLWLLAIRCLRWPAFWLPAAALAAVLMQRYGGGGSPRPTTATSDAALTSRPIARPTPTFWHGLPRSSGSFVKRPWTRRWSWIAALATHCSPRPPPPPRPATWPTPPPAISGHHVADGPIAPASPASSDSSVFL